MDRDEPKLKYAHVERERRFLLETVPLDWRSLPARQIHDRYIDGTRFRLRAVQAGGEPTMWKLGHKVRFDPRSAERVAHTSLYLNDAEVSILKALPAAELVKTRRTRAVEELVWAVDEFLGPLLGLVLAEADLGDLGELPEVLPVPIVTEVTDDDRFSGSALARISAEGALDLIAAVRAGS